MQAHDGYYLTIAQNENVVQAEAFSKWLQAEIRQAEIAAEALSTG